MVTGRGQPLPATSRGGYLSGRVSTIARTPILNRMCHHKGPRARNLPRRTTREQRPARVTPEDADGQLPTGGGGKRGPWCGCDLAEPGQYVSCGTNARGTHTAREGAGQRASMPNMDGTQIIQVLTDVTTSLPRFLASPSANINRPKQLFRQTLFRLLRACMRDPSPALEALSVSDVKSDSEVLRIWPRSTFSLLAASDDGSGEETEDDVGVQEIEDDVGVQESWGDNDELGQVMERNTECNALIPADLADQDLLDMPDPLSEGMIAIRAHDESTRPEPIPMDTSRPIFQRDRRTIARVHGDPGHMLERTGRRYVLASDLSDEPTLAPRAARARPGTLAQMGARRAQITTQRRAERKHASSTATLTQPLPFTRSRCTGPRSCAHIPMKGHLESRAEEANRPADARRQSASPLLHRQSTEGLLPALALSVRGDSRDPHVAAAPCSRTAKTGSRTAKTGSPPATDTHTAECATGHAMYASAARNYAPDVRAASISPPSEDPGRSREQVRFPLGVLFPDAQKSNRNATREPGILSTDARRGTRCAHPAPTRPLSVTSHGGYLNGHVSTIARTLSLNSMRHRKGLGARNLPYAKHGGGSPDERGRNAARDGSLDTYRVRVQRTTREQHPARVTPRGADGQLSTGGGGKRGPWCGRELEAEPGQGQYVSCRTNGCGTRTAREGAGQRASTPNMDGTRKMSGGGVFSAASYLVPCEQGRRALGMVTLWHGQSAVVLPEMRDKSADTYPKGQSSTGDGRKRGRELGAEPACVKTWGTECRLDGGAKYGLKCVNALTDLVIVTRAASSLLYGNAYRGAVTVRTEQSSSLDASRMQDQAGTICIPPSGAQCSQERPAGVVPSGELTGHSARASGTHQCDEFEVRAVSKVSYALGMSGMQDGAGTVHIALLGARHMQDRRAETVGGTSLPRHTVVLRRPGTARGSAMCQRLGAERADRAVQMFLYTRELARAQGGVCWWRDDGGRERARVGESGRERQAGQWGHYQTSLYVW
ncbi:predicted protein [Postia placenta Mad-698-R]|nr:predicted protein [Postia placenta Mad-698-R]